MSDLIKLCIIKLFILILNTSKLNLYDLITNWFLW